MEFDLLLKGADILTPGQPILHGGYVGVKGNRIAALGQGAPVGMSAARVINLQGRLIIPGLVNTHLHSALTMVRGTAADLGFAPSYTKGIPNAMDLDPEQATVLARLGALEALLAGSTTIGEHFVHMDAALPGVLELGLRVHASLRLHDVDFAEVAQGKWVYRSAIGDQLLQANLALHDRWHGKDGGRVVIQFAAHAADTCSTAFLRRIAEVVKARDARVNTHLGQSKAEVQRVHQETGLTPLRVFEEAGLLDDHLLCGHCLYIDEQDLPAFFASGAHVVHIPKCNAASGRIAPVHKFKAAGMNIALATDTQHGDMIELMRWALATGRIQEGRVSDQWQPADVFAMATINGAKALGAESNIGSLEVGKKADLVVIDCRHPHWTPRTNMLGNLVHIGQGRDVEMVVIDGRIAVENSRSTLVDQDRVIEDANRVVAQLWEKARA